MRSRSRSTDLDPQRFSHGRAREETRGQEENPQSKSITLVIWPQCARKSKKASKKWPLCILYCSTIVSAHCILLYLHSTESPDPIVFNALGSGVLSTMLIVRVLFVKESSDVRGTRTRPWRRVPAPAGGVAAAAAWLSPPAYEGARGAEVPRGGGEGRGGRGGGGGAGGQTRTTTRVWWAHHTRRSIDTQEYRTSPS